MTNLSNLPPPPKGKTGVTLGSLSHLPPPPSGGKGMTLDQVKASTPKEPKPGLLQQAGNNLYNNTIGDAKGSLKNAAVGAYNFLSSAEQSTGNDLTAGARAGIAANASNTLNNSQSQTERALTDLIAKQKSQGVDTSHAEQTLAGVRRSSISNKGDISKDVPEVNKSNMEGLGDVATVGLDALTAGTYGAAAKGTKTGVLAAEKLAPSFVKLGAKLDKVVNPVVKSIVKKVIPEGKNLAEKALSLGKKELESVDKSKLKYLTDKGFDMTKTEGGFIKEKMYKMTDQVKKLATEFGHVLTGKTPEENIKLVQTELGRLQQQSKTAFDGVNKIFNKDTLVTGIKKSISDMSDSVYEGYTKEAQASFSEKRISDFLSHVKEGTLKGLDDALESFRAANAKSDATLSKATDATYEAVKQHIIDNLPKERAAIYNAANQSQAKLFDVAEILKGKIQASVGTLGKAGKALKYGAAVLATGAVGEGIRKLTGF